MARKNAKDRDVKQSRNWMNLGIAALTALTASICCIVPVVLMMLSAGTVWASRLSVLEPYRPILIGVSLALLGFVFYRVYFSPVDQACSEGACKPGDRVRSNRAAFWMVSAPILLLLAFPAAAKFVRARVSACHGGLAGQPNSAASGEACCVVPTSFAESAAIIAPQTRPATIDSSREAVFDIETLQCPAVKGVGCGSMLWPVLIRIDQIDGVSSSFSNWTGTRLRISAKPGSDTKATAERVRAFLAADGRHPTELVGAKMNDALRGAKWYDATGLVTLSSYEFRTIAKRRVDAFARDQKLNDTQRGKLLQLVDQLWDKAADGMALPDPKPDAYRPYWQSRFGRFVQAFSEHARGILNADQIKQLEQAYQQNRGSGQE